MGTGGYAVFFHFLFFILFFIFCLALSTWEIFQLILMRETGIYMEFSVMGISNCLFRVNEVLLMINF